MTDLGLDSGMVYNIQYMKNFKRNLFTLLLVSFIVLLPVISFAQNDPGDKGINPLGDKGISPLGDKGKGSATSNTTSSQNVANNKIENPIKVDNINDFIKTILTGVIKISIPIIALAIIYSGFLFVSARGNSEKLGEAKRALLYTAIGAAILLGSWAIAQIISNTVLAL